MNQPHAHRRESVRRQLKKTGVESMLITDQINVRYLTGFTGDSSYLLLTGDDEILISDSRYSIQIAEECPDLPCEIRTAQTSLLQFTCQTIKSAKTTSLAIESHDLVKQNYDQLKSTLTASSLVDTTGIVEDLRAIKDKQEISLIRQSIRIAQRAFAAIRAQMTGDQTEREIAHDLEHQIRRFGGTRCSFDPIVGVGPRSALPHGHPSSLEVARHPFLLIDWGAEYQGYASDLTRILVTGKISPKLARVYELVLRAQQTAIGKLRPGVKLSDVDRAARKVIENGGFGKRFGHGLGHGFGLRIHEQPFMNPSSTGKLRAGMVVTVEPGVYLSDWGGVRIEDDVLITKSGHEVLTSVPKQLDQCVLELN